MAGIAQGKPKPYFHCGPLIEWDWGVGVWGCSGDGYNKKVFFIFYFFIYIYFFIPTLNIQRIWPNINFLFRSMKYCFFHSMFE